LLFLSRFSTAQPYAEHDTAIAVVSVCLSVTWHAGVFKPYIQMMVNTIKLVIDGYDILYAIFATLIIVVRWSTRSVQQLMRYVFIIYLINGH